jgi:death-on-curing protein
MIEPIWVELPEVLAAQDMQIAQHGGSPGIRDANMLDSALARPKNLYLYDENATLQHLAASYAFGISRNHPFVDGNKRTALVVCEGFLRLNGIVIEVSPQEKYRAYIDLASGSLSEREFADWLIKHTVPLHPGQA